MQRWRTRQAQQIASSVDGLLVLELGDVAVVNDANLLTAFSEIE